ncbi:DUF2637 domain-containing protein [Streptomyces sp. NPDC053720]|uniref:DUF2637 domain-containing protein n=1 Tax=Streptomyces sp. NPDC053720 TaxID=3154855 RepID=UPI00344AA554
MVEELPGARTAPPQMESAVTDADADAFEVEAEDVEEERSSRNRGLMIPLACLAVAAGLAAAGVGFALSYGALRSAAVAWDFGAGWQSYAFPIGVDGLIVALYTVDLVLAWKRMSRPWIKAAAHAVTLVTIGLNMSAAAGSAPGSPGLTDALVDHPARLLAHAAMPIAYVLLTEAARWAIVRTAQLEAGHDDARLTLADWALRFPTTWAIFKHAKTWPASYSDARTHVRDLAIYRVWLKHREEIEAGLEEGRVGVLDRMPDLLAPYGVSVDRARAIPDEMREREQEIQQARDRAEQERQREQEREREQEQREREQREREQQRERERQDREDKHADRLAVLAARAEETRLTGEVAVLEARTTGVTRAAEAEAEAAADTASIQAAAAREAAGRAAAEEARLAAAEERAEETARTAALRRKAAEDERQAAGLARDAAAAAAEKARLAKEASDHDAATAANSRQAAEDYAAAEAAGHRAAELRAAAARIERQAAEDEDFAGLGSRERAVRKVARMVIERAGGDWQRLPLADIERDLRVGNSTASDYRKEAAVLIEGGYTLPKI